MAPRLGKNENRRGPSIYFPAHHTSSPDGARIRYFDSEEALPPLVLANGLGGPATAWHPYVARWKGRFRVLTWDYRGLYGSTLPHRSADLGVAAHARDLGAVLDAAGIEQAAVFGWSMGVQVGLEFYSQSPHRLSHLALINGTYGRPLGGVPLPFSGLTLPPLVKRLKHLHRVSGHLLRRTTRSPLSHLMLRRLGLIAPTFSRELFQQFATEFETIDLDLYFETLAQLHEHDAENQLKNIRVPTLVMAGSRDVLTPPWLARRMAALVPGSEMFMIPGGTHYCAAEYPDLVGERVENFLSRKSQVGAERAHEYGAICQAEATLPT